MGLCNVICFCCTLPYVHSSIAIILMGKRELVALLNLSSWCLVVLERLFLAVPWGCLRFVIVVFPNHTHLLLLVFLFRYSFIRNIQLGHQLYMHCTILWPTKWYKMIKFHELFLMFCIFFQRQKLIFLRWNFAFSSIQTVHVFTVLFIVFAS